jgi:hypothetical protein
VEWKEGWPYDIVGFIGAGLEGLYSLELFHGLLLHHLHVSHPPWSPTDLFSFTFSLLSSSHGQVLHQQATRRRSPSDQCRSLYTHISFMLLCTWIPFIHHPLLLVILLGPTQRPGHPLHMWNLKKEEISTHNNIN